MAGYSSAPAARKLGLRPGGRLALIGAPEGWDVEGRPPDVSVVRDAGAGPAGPDLVVVAFHRLAEELAPSLQRLAPEVFPDAALWAAWPRRAGGHHSDITDNDVRAAALPLGLVDVKVAAIDQDWSGLRLVWRKERRAGPLP